MFKDPLNVLSAILAGLFLLSLVSLLGDESHSRKKARSVEDSLQLITPPLNNPLNDLAIGGGMR